MKTFLKNGDNDFFRVHLTPTFPLTSSIVHYNIPPIFDGEDVSLVQIVEIMKRHSFASFDKIFINQSNEYFSMLHSHPDVEARWTIDGIGHFFIPLGQSLVKIEVEKGDFIIIKENIKHWYEFLPENGGFHSLIRFFSQNDSRETNYVE